MLHRGEMNARSGPWANRAQNGQVMEFGLVRSEDGVMMNGEIAK